MQMINVLQRLAELDESPKATMTQEQNLLTQSNLETSQVNECGMMSSPTPHTPASMNITANSGMELTGMLRDLMSLAGIKSDSGDKSSLTSVPHSLELDKGNDIHKTLSIIDTMNSEEGSEIKGLDQDGDGDHDMKDHELEKEKNEGQEDRTYDNSPEEEIEAHDYGDKQVTPKPQGFKQRVGDNPYKPVSEEVQSISAQLLKAYEEFKKQ